MAASRRPRDLRQELAAGRELAVLTGGPWLPAWYWRDELEAMQRAGRRYPDEHPSAVLRGYYPTDEWRPHPSNRPAAESVTGAAEDSEEEGVRGRVWRYRPPVGGTRSDNEGGEVTWTQRR